MFLLRKWTEDDLDSLVKHANNFNIAKFLTNQFPYPYTRQDGENYLSFASKENPTQLFAIEINGDAVGSIGLFPQSDIHAKNAEMGYWLSEDYWGQGIMTQAIRELVRYGFEAFDINRIYARPFGTNKGSQRVLEKAGFTLEAKFSKVLFKNDEYLDELVYAVRKG